jgi:adenylate kinase
VKGLAYKVLLLIGVLGVGKTTVLIKTVEALKRTLRINTGNHTQKQPFRKPKKHQPRQLHHSQLRHGRHLLLFYQAFP